MKLTLAKNNKDRYIIIEEGGKTVTYKAKMIMKTSEITCTDTEEDFVYESEIYEARFLREESNKEKQSREIIYADQETMIPAT